MAKSLFCMWLCGIFLLAISCSDSISSGSHIQPDGVKIEWTPSHPRVGDLLELRIFYPAGLKEGVLPFSPGAKPLDQLKIDYVQTGRTYFYRTRITGAGTWVLGEGGKELWKVNSEAGDLVDLKRFEPQSLWIGEPKQ